MSGFYKSAKKFFFGEEKPKESTVKEVAYNAAKLRKIVAEKLYSEDNERVYVELIAYFDSLIAQNQLQASADFEALVAKSFAKQMEFRTAMFLTLYFWPFMFILAPKSGEVVRYAPETTLFKVVADSLLHSTELRAMLANLAIELNPSARRNAFEAIGHILFPIFTSKGLKKSSYWEKRRTRIGARKLSDFPVFIFFLILSKTWKYTVGFYDGVDPLRVFFTANGSGQQITISEDYSANDLIQMFNQFIWAFTEFPFLFEVSDVKTIMKLSCDLMKAWSASKTQLLSEIDKPIEQFTLIQPILLSVLKKCNEVLSERDVLEVISFPRLFSAYFFNLHSF